MAWLDVITSLGIAVPHPAAVQGYVRSHADMVESLLALARAAAVRLGSEARLSMEPYQDPELDDQYLTLYVSASERDRALLASIDQLNEEHEHLLANTSGWLVVAASFSST